MEIVLGQDSDEMPRTSRGRYQVISQRDNKP